MQGYGPITVTPSLGVVSQSVDNTADRLLLSNRSIYDVFVSVQSARPTASNVLSPAWPIVVHAGDQAIFTLTNQDKSPTPFGVYWSGVVWLSATAQQTGLALTGVKSAASQFYILALHPGDPTPTLAARPTTTDLSSQPRVFSIPVATVNYFSQQHSTSAVGMNAGNYFQRPLGAYNSVTTYLNDFTVSIASAGAAITMQFGTVWFDQSGTIITNSFVEWRTYQFFGVCNIAMAFVCPPVLGGQPGNVFGAQTTYELGIGVNVIGVANATAWSFTLGLTFDNYSPASVQTLGSGSAITGANY